MGRTAAGRRQALEQPHGLLRTAAGWSVKKILMPICLANHRSDVRDVYCVARLRGESFLWQPTPGLRRGEKVGRPNESAGRARGVMATFCNSPTETAPRRLVGKALAEW